MLNPELAEILDILNKQCSISEENKEYFSLRAREFMLIIKTGIFETKRLKIALEIGCGNGFISALLSQHCDKVITIDLPYKDDLSHSKGLDEARRLISILNLKDRVVIKDGRAENIPCADNSIDLIYSHFVFDHILDFSAAFKEINRVLKADGIMVTVVPNALERIIWLKDYLLSACLIKNYLRPFYNIFWRKMRLNESFRDFYWIVPPHDRRFTFLGELMRYRVSSWKKMFYDNKHRINKIVPIRYDAETFFTQKVNSQNDR